MRRLLLLRGTFAVILLGLAVVAFASDEAFLGVLLVAFATVNAVLVAGFAWRQSRSVGAGPPAGPPEAPEDDPLDHGSPGA